MVQAELWSRFRWFRHVRCRFLPFPDSLPPFLLPLSLSRSHYIPQQRGSSPSVAIPFPRATIIFSKWYWDDPEDYARRLAEITKAHTTQLDADIVFIQDTFEKLIEMEKRERIKEDKEMEKRGRWMEKKKRELEALGIDLGELEGEMGLGQGGGGREGNRWRA
jgi:hypothetical protein